METTKNELSVVYSFNEKFINKKDEIIMYTKLG